jgi:glutamate synthase domain-containing protein 2/glutamate synthase domain-containing protein 3
MRVFLGRKPNIFEPKEFIPLKPVIELEGPVISLGQMQYLYDLQEKSFHPDLRSYVIDITFEANSTLEEFEARLDELREECITAIKKGHSLLILSDRKANKQRLPFPSLLVLTYFNIGLNHTGRRMRTSLIMEVGDARNAHQLATLLSYGASCVCPYLAIETAMTSTDPKLTHLFPEEREKQLLRAMHDGILRIMAKRGISVFRSYQGSKLFTPVGLGQDILDKFFKKKKSVLGGMTLKGLLKFIKSLPQEGDELGSHFLFKEHAAGKMGESHTMTSKRARFVHKMLQVEDLKEAQAQFKEFSREYEEKPLLIRHLLAPRKASAPLAIHEVSSLEEILKTFGSGAMSFGAISAEAQRDLILAFREIGGRSNSGEGGENPYYETEGITSSVKQLASGRFGVTAEYLVSGNEIQIKIAQGAKPGEGGQLMGVKVTEEIARARFTSPGVDLISPAPQHDIYSIEDLKQLIHELKALREGIKISVKLVSGENIGAIAVGVAKAGADIIQISGGDGGTGAASLLSMKHAGLPLEIGLLEVHQALTQNSMRSRVILRADGGLTTAKDIIVASMLGADEFDFGKLLLVGEGCIMARICEKNTCPAGIATHNPKFKALYKGEVSKVVRLLQCLALEVQEQLAAMGKKSLSEIRGMNHGLMVNSQHIDLINDRDINLDYFTKDYSSPKDRPSFEADVTSPLNHAIVKNHTEATFTITNRDRAIPATLAGSYAWEESLIKRKIKAERSMPEKRSLLFRGSAGQGFAVFNVANIDIRLEGEANDSVAKGMSGGTVVIVPPVEKHPSFESESNTIIGNCALYGATGGTLFVHGRAGDRFAVRNSGATAIVESVGLHACEYMSGGMVWILGDAKMNIGAGMSGGAIFLKKENFSLVNQDYLIQVPIQSEDVEMLHQLAENYYEHTRGTGIKRILDQNLIKKEFIKLVPKRKLT